MTYKELYEKATWLLEHSKISGKEYDNMIEPLNAEISDAPTIDAVTVADIIEVEKERNYWHDLADSYERTILKLNNALQESVPVRHGYWKNYKDEHTCSCCGETVTGDWYDQDNDAYWVCPWCGAWMDVERKEE